jgi:hypothetical protein
LFGWLRAFSPLCLLRAVGNGPRLLAEIACGNFSGIHRSVFFSRLAKSVVFAS